MGGDRDYENLVPGNDKVPVANGSARWNSRCPIVLVGQDIVGPIGSQLMVDQPSVGQIPLLVNTIVDQYDCWSHAIVNRCHH
jgi:hypothetical protein